MAVAVKELKGIKEREREREREEQILVCHCNGIRESDASLAGQCEHGRVVQEVLEGHDRLEDPS